MNNLSATTGVPLRRLPVSELDGASKARLELTHAWQRRMKAL